MALDEWESWLWRRGINAAVALALAAVMPLSGCKRGSTLSSVPPSDPRIVGSWTIVGGDYPLTDTYGSDGMLVQRVNGRTTEATPYRIEKGYLICSLPQPDGTVVEQKVRFTLNGDTLSFVDTDGSTRTFKRNSP